MATGKYLFFGQTIASGILIAAADTTVITVIFTIVGKFYQTADIDIMIKVFDSGSTCGSQQRIAQLAIGCLQKFFDGGGVSCSQLEVCRLSQVFVHVMNPF